MTPPNHLTLLTLLLATAASNAQADTLVHTFPLERRPTPWGELVQVPLFRAEWGQLHTVDLELSLHVVGAVGIENLLDTPNVLEVEFSLRAAVLSPDGNPWVLTSTGAQFYNVLPGFDGSIDFSGSSGTVRSGFETFTNAVTHLQSPVNLARFTRPEGASDVPIELGVRTANSTRSSGGLELRSRQFCAGVLQVRYQFTPAAGQ